MSKLKRRRVRRARGGVDAELRNGVVAARPERMTAENSTCGEPAPPDCAMPLERLDRVRRAARHVPAARWQQGRERYLVSANEKNEERAHESIYCRELRRDSSRLLLDCGREGGELVEAQTVCRRSCVDDHVDGGQLREDHCSCQFAKPALQEVPLDRRLSVLGDHEPDPWVTETRKGSAHPNVEMFGAKSLPCSRDLAQLGATRDAVTARKRGGSTRRMRRRSLREIATRDRYPRPWSGARVLARELHGQPLPSLLPAPSEYLTAPLVGHAKAKSVSLDAALVARAVGRLAHS